MSTTVDDLAKEIEETRGFIRRILTGEISPETSPHLFEEDNDTLIHALVAIDVDDRAWLEAQLADEAYPQVTRDLVRLYRPQMSGTK